MDYIEGIEPGNHKNYATLLIDSQLKWDKTEQILKLIVENSKC